MRPALAYHGAPARCLPAAASPAGNVLLKFRIGRLEAGHRVPPIVETRQLSVEALLTEGVPIEVVRVEGNEESGYVEVEAKILR